MSKKPFADLLEKMNLVLDEPEENDIQFSFETHAQNLSDFIAHDRIPTPFAIAIHGEWGSGKTTFCKLVKKKLDDAQKLTSQKIHILEFNAWEYERSDVFTALLFQIKKIFDANNKSIFTKSLLSFASDVVLRRTVGISINDMAEHFKDFTEHISTLKENLEGIIDHKLIIFIDDLDRCNVENTLSMLEGIKMFLSVKNVIFVVAIDMTKIERAWALRYNSSNSLDDDNIAMIEGKEHVEKMFQLKLSLPYKSEGSLKSYIETMAESLNDENMKFFIQNLPPNPRKIKRTLNLIYYILYNYNYITNNDDTFVTEHETENQYLNTLITWIIITNNHRDIADFAKNNPTSLIYAAAICTNFAHLDILETCKSDIKTAKKARPIRYMFHGVTVMFDHTTIEIWHILEKIIDLDSDAFDILQHFGNMLKLKKDFVMDKKTMDKLAPFEIMLSDIIEKTPL